MFRQRGGIETARSHWSQLMEGMQGSPKELYAAITEGIGRRQIPDCKLSRVLWREGGVLSAKRLYLRAACGEDLVDICGAPFGTGFFASSWLCTPPPSIIVAVVLLFLCLFAGWHLVGWLIQLQSSSFFGRNPQITEEIYVARALLGLDVLCLFIVLIFGIIRPLFFPPRETFYRYDTAQMFYRAVHNALIEVIQELRSAQGLRLLTEDEAKPIMREFLR